MSNKIVEMHDSKIAEIITQGGAAVIVFALVFIHESEGLPGRDRGTVFKQQAELWIDKASEFNISPSRPYTIYAGRLKAGNDLYENSIPIPFSFIGPIALELSIMDDEDVFSSIKIEGEGATLKLLGTPTYLEVFPGN